MTNTAAAAVWASRVLESSCGYWSSLALLPSFRRRLRDLDSSGRGELKPDGGDAPDAGGKIRSRSRLRWPRIGFDAPSGQVQCRRSTTRR